jgi:hypothetical protein
MGVDRTSVASRIVHNAAAADLSGGKTSEVSFTKVRVNLAVERTTDFHNLFLSTVRGPLSSSRRAS